MLLIELERTLIPTLARHLNNWYRFIDNFYFINYQSIDYVLLVLNNFHSRIQFSD